MVMLVIWDAIAPNIDAYTDSAMGICDKMLNNTKFSFCTHKER